MTFSMIVLFEAVAAGAIETLLDCCTVSLGKRKNPHDAFVNLDSAIYIATNSKKEKAAALISWLVKKGVEKLQEEHQIQTEEKDAAIALLNDDLDAKRHKVHLRKAAAQCMP